MWSNHACTTGKDAAGVFSANGSLTPGRAAMLRSANYFDGSRPALTPPASPGMMLNPGAKPIIWSHRAGRRGREAEGGGLLNRYTGLNLYRGFESLRLR